jgi:catechol 2,3-dioxygenase-like lactoylglutathione lyase family enzyme
MTAKISGGKPVSRILHIAISSQNPGKSAEFYKTALGFEEIHRFGLDPDNPPENPEDAPRPSGVTLTDGHVNLTILKFGKDQIGKPLDYDGLHHIGVLVDEDIETMTEKLEAMGAPCIAGVDDIPPGAHFEIKFRGPDDVVFDITDRPWPGSASGAAGADVKADAAE